MAWVCRRAEGRGLGEGTHLGRRLALGTVAARCQHQECPLLDAPARGAAEEDGHDLFEFGTHEELAAPSGSEEGCSM